MISILSAVVLMLTIGTLVQRQDMVASFLGSEDETAERRAVLVPDRASVAADTLTRIEVLGNDEALPHEARDALAVLTQPECGRVFVQDGALQFLAEGDCPATLDFLYGLDDVEAEGEGRVVVTVRGATGTRDAAEPAGPSRVAGLSPRGEPGLPS
ncbi:MAG: hypothetical protein ACFBWO_15950, partial [Paracoccaceae bacterium]